MKLRLNKFLAQCGLGSRRKAEEYITSRRISVNGALVRNIATFVDPETDRITVDNKLIRPPDRFLYLILNKPKGLITTASDTHGRPTVMEIIPEKYRRKGVFPVGRLDKDTEGLLLFTNDGELAHRLNLPRFHVPKEYFVELDRPLEDEHAREIEEGLYIHQLKLKTRSASLRMIDEFRKQIRITITEGKKRQIRYTFKNLGYKVVKLRRIGYGPLTLARLHKGSLRTLTDVEIARLKKLVGQ